VCVCVCVSVCTASSTKSHTTSSCEESSETSPDLSPLHGVLPCGGMTVGHDDPSKRPVEPGRPTRISVCKGKCGLGVKVIGGSDTNLVSLSTSDVGCYLLLFTVLLNVYL